MLRYCCNQKILHADRALGRISSFTRSSFIPSLLMVSILISISLSRKCDILLHSSKMDMIVLVSSRKKKSYILLSTPFQQACRVLLDQAPILCNRTACPSQTDDKLCTWIRCILSLLMPRLSSTLSNRSRLAPPFLDGQTNSASTFACFARPSSLALVANADLAASSYAGHDIQCS